MDQIAVILAEFKVPFKCFSVQLDDNDGCAVIILANTG